MLDLRQALDRNGTDIADVSEKQDVCPEDHLCSLISK